jgi:hypothetical protein
MLHCVLLSHVWCQEMLTFACCCCFSRCSYAQQHRGLLVRVVPIKASHTLEIQWDIPPSECEYSLVCGDLAPEISPVTEHALLDRPHVYVWFRCPVAGLMLLLLQPCGC